MSPIQLVPQIMARPTQIRLLCANLALIVIMFAMTICKPVLVDARYCYYPFQSLSRWFIPVNYDIELNPSIMGHSHSGQVKIIINSVGPRDSKRHIIMHAGNNLKIQGVKLYAINGKQEPESIKNLDSLEEVKIRDICHDDKYDILVIEMDPKYLDKREIPLTSILVIIDFLGVTHVNGQGLVRMGYDGQEDFYMSRRIMYTKFDRFKAHFVFPCFDEPRLRATIKLTLNNISVQEYAFSTYHIVDHNPDYDQMRGPIKVRKYEFLRTFPMSMHNFGFVVGRLSHKKIGTISGGVSSLFLMKTKGYPMPADITRVLLLKAWNKVSNYNTMKYPLKNVNVIAHPGISLVLESNFAGGIIVDANRIIRQELHHPEEEVTLVATMIDLFMRQWYGFVVTRELDHESWFFEGLIGWYTLKLTDQILNTDDEYSQPALLNYAMLYAKRFKSKAMYEDAKLDSKPLLVEQDYQIEITDVIAPEFMINQYTGNDSVASSSSQTINDGNTSTSLSRTDGSATLSTWVTKRGDFILSEVQRVKAIGIISNYEQSCGDKWPKVLTRYMKKYTYKMAQVHHIMSNIEQECYWQTKTSLNLFLGLSGFPLVKVHCIDGNTLSMSQERFLPDYTQSVLTPDIGSENKWILPVGFKYGDHFSQWNRQTSFRLMNIDADMRVSLARGFDLSKPGSWIKLNVGGKGYYRVLYGDKLLDSVLKAAQYNALSDLDCFNLLDDAVALFKSGKVGAYYLIQILRVLAWKPDEFIQETVVNAYKEIKKLYIQYSDVYNGLCDLGVELFGNVFMEHEFSFTNVITDEGISATIQIYEQLAGLDFQPMIDSGLELYRSQHMPTLDPLLHKTVFIIIARNGTDDDFTHLLLYLLNPRLNSSRALAERIVTALAYATEESRLNFTWLKIQDLDGQLISKFILTLLETVDGQLFAINTVAERLAHIHGKFNFDTYRSLVNQFCEILANKTDTCSTISPISATIGHEEWNDMIMKVRETRRRTYYLQRLDYNKLVF